MSTPKQHADNAARQAAYRARHQQDKPPTDAQLALLARNLHFVLAEALAEGFTDLPAAIMGRHAGETLRRLVHYLDPHPDPIQYLGREKPSF